MDPKMRKSFNICVLITFDEIEYKFCIFRYVWRKTSNELYTQQNVAVDEYFSRGKVNLNLGFTVSR